METQIIVPEDLVVEEIVKDWNNMVNNVENSTISFCVRLNDKLKEYPQDSVRSILKKVNTHPDIKRTLSLDRIWQGLRLIKRRPDLLYNGPIEEEDKPYLKKDGSIFWEFYFELYKHNIPEDTRHYLEEKGKTESWSYRDLRNNIISAKDKLDLSTVEDKNEKRLLLIEMNTFLSKQELSVLKNLWEHIKRYPL